VRSAYLDLVTDLDRLVFFVAALRPYHQLASIAGDLAMCWLGKCLSHLIQEIEKLMVQLRQSRLEVMHASNTHLQDVAKRGLHSASSMEVRWMQGLRHINEVQLDDLHKAIAAQCTEILAATTLAREAELRSEARRGLEDVVAAFQSADFQARCGLALSDGLMEDMQQLGQSVAAGGDLVRMLPG